MSRNYNTDDIQKVDFKLWRILFSRCLRYKKYLIGVLLISIVMAVIQTAFPKIIGDIIDSVTNQNDDWKKLILLYLVGVFTFSFTVWLFILNCGKLSTKMAHDIRTDCFDKLQKLSFSFYSHKPVGWLVTRLTSDADRLARIFSWGLLDLVWGILFLIFTICTMLWMNVHLALIVLSVVPVLLIVSLYFKRKLLKVNREVRKTNSIITGSFSEAITGVKTTKTLVREKENLAEFKHKTHDMFELSVKNAVMSSMYLPVVMIIGSIGAGLAIWLGTNRALASTISIGTLVAFIGYSRTFFHPVQELARLLTEFQTAQAAAERIVSLLETDSDIVDSPEVLEMIKQAELEYKKNNSIAKDGQPNAIQNIEFKDVDFEYVPGEPVLKKFNLKINKGETIAIVGPTGGGKSTIISLTCRFYEPTNGSILINNVDYRNRSLDWLNSNLGIVLQTPQLFSGTIADNIRYGKLEASDEEILAASKLVHADNFIQKLPDKYETKIGEGGNELSTGQRQLISFARAIISNPQIFIMDEATSSIDTETEQQIQIGLETVLKNRISFIIAHRLSTIKSADRILYVEDGKIIEQGSHHDLLLQRGKYFELYSSQFTNEHTETLLAE